MNKFARTRFTENTGELLPMVGKWEIPEILPERLELPERWVGFNYAKTTVKDRGSVGVHFFLDDYQFDRIWHNWERYADLLMQFGAVMTPDFSLYTSYPLPIQIYNHYRKHYVGAYLQRYGVKVVPTIGWGDERSYDFCFDGEPVGTTVAVSSVGAMQNRESRGLFVKGYREMMDRLKPTSVLFMGSVPEGCDGDIVRLPKFTSKWEGDESSDQT